MGPLKNLKISTNLFPSKKWWHLIMEIDMHLIKLAKEKTNIINSANYKPQTKISYKTWTATF